mgnify:FL=1
MESKRLDDLEEVIAHQDKQIQDLSDMIIAQNKDIARLQREIVKLGGKIKELEHASHKDDGEGLSLLEQALRDKPPHY